MMDSFFRFLTVLVLCFTALIVAAMVLLVIVLRMKPNPLKELLTALLWRLGVTVAVTAVGLPIQPVPVVDGAYDLAGALTLAVYWLLFFHDVSRALKRDRPSTPPMKTVGPIKP